LLRVQDGRAGAREGVWTACRKGKALSLKLTSSATVRRCPAARKLNAFIAANPDFAPAYYLLSQEYSEDRLGSQGLSDKRAGRRRWKNSSPTKRMAACSNISSTRPNLLHGSTIRADALRRLMVCLTLRGSCRP
jgi:hypothetical protein